MFKTIEITVEINDDQDDRETVEINDDCVIHVLLLCTFIPVYWKGNVYRTCNSFLIYFINHI